MLISVIICTRDRPQSLTRAVASIADCNPLPTGDEWELVVVDNATECTAGTLLASYGDRLPLRVVHEPAPGLSTARNRGVAASRGQWLIWTDDDITVSPGWLEEYRSAISRLPEARVMGGPILPCLEGDPPHWILDGFQDIRSAFASREPDDVAPVFQASDSLPYGANFAIRRADAVRFPFPAYLGRHPERPTRGSEESVVMERVLAEGHGHWLRQAVVTHHIGPARQTASYIRSYYFDVGFVRSMLQAHGATRRRTWLRFRSSLRRALTYEVDLVLCTWRRIDGPVRGASLRDAATNWGEAKGRLIALVNAKRVADWHERNN